MNADKQPFFVSASIGVHRRPIYSSPFRHWIHYLHHFHSAIASAGSIITVKPIRVSLVEPVAYLRIELYSGQLRCRQFVQQRPPCQQSPHVLREDVPAAVTEMRTEAGARDV